MAVTITSGTISTVTDTTNIIKDVSDVIDQLSPRDTPLLALIGKDSLHFPCVQVKHEWWEDEDRPLSGTLGAAYTAGSGQLTVSSGEGTYIWPNDLLMVNAVAFRVLVVSGDVLTVTAGLGSSTDANCSNGATWRRIGHAAEEGGVARYEAKKSTVVNPYNYAQIWKDWVSVTGTMMNIKRYGYISEKAYQEAKVIADLAKAMERALIYGERSYDAGPPRHSTAGGLIHYVYHAGIAGSWNTVLNASGAYLDYEDHIRTVHRAIWDLGGECDIMLVNSYQKAIISDWGVPHVRTGPEQDQYGFTVETLITDFGELRILMDRWLKPDEAIIIDSKQIGFGPLTGRALHERDLTGTTSADAEWWEILGEYTIEVHKPSTSFGWIYGLATS